MICLLFVHGFQTLVHPWWPPPPKPVDRGKTTVPWAEKSKIHFWRYITKNLPNRFSILKNTCWPATKSGLDPLSISSRLRINVSFGTYALSTVPATPSTHVQGLGVRQQKAPIAHEDLYQRRPDSGAVGHKGTIPRPIKKNPVLPNQCRKSNKSIGLAILKF